MSQMTHVMGGVHSGRFGWRVWHLDESRARLLSPIHRGEMRFGARVESVCQHRQRPSRARTGLRCGIYFEDLDHAIERWRWEADRVGAENVASRSARRWATSGTWGSPSTSRADPRIDDVSSPDEVEIHTAAGPSSDVQCGPIGGSYNNAEPRLHCAY
jgi:hypothetical protein